MNRSAIITLLAVICTQSFVSAEPPPATPSSPAKPTGIPDPRSAMMPVILYHNQKEHKDSLQGPLLIFARWDTKPPNQILGIEGSFTDEQIIAGLRKFYREWRPPADDATRPRPQLILALQNWGCGAGLYEPLKALSADFEIDVYQLYPVTSQIQSNPSHPTPNDKRLGELIKGA
ncbi:MAG: hypothetical protein V4675_11970 [Verrucomicrobiota bacterium]